MLRTDFALAVATIGILSTAVPNSAICLPQATTTKYMQVYDEVPPIGAHIKFCQRLPHDCQKDDRGSARVEMTAQRWSELDQINRYVNRFIVPTTEMELYGVRDYWAYPDERRRGDCNAYTLLKRKMLAAAGWPLSSLLITVVVVQNGEGHAILTVRTNEGDFVLDNLNEDILPWYKAPYQFLMRQSSADPHAWLSLVPPRRFSPVEVGGAPNSTKLPR
jgi:predicted transglutaminase-like cysteine proteinase